MRVLPLLPLLLSGWCVVPAHADEAQDWLKRLGQAEQQHSYQGTFVYERNGSFSTHSIWHLVRDGKVRERLMQLDGAPQEVVRADGRTECISGTLFPGPGNASTTSDRQLDPDKLNRVYNVAKTGESRVSGRAVVVITLTPRDQHRFGVELYLDRETGLPLKSLLLNDKGQLLERFQFTELETTDPDEQDLKPTADCKPVPTSTADAVPVESAQSWYSEWLPSGFELIDSSVRIDPRTQSEVTSLLYDDGLTRFSVFLEALKGASAQDARVQLGPTVAVSRRLNTPQGEMMATVVGEIPIGTAERIALSMRIGKAQQQAKP